MTFGLLIAALLGLCGAALAHYIGIGWAFLLMAFCIVGLVGWCCFAIGSRLP